MKQKIFIALLLLINFNISAQHELPTIPDRPIDVDSVELFCTNYQQNISDMWFELQYKGLDDTPTGTYKAVITDGNLFVSVVECQVDNNKLLSFDDNILGVKKEFRKNPEFYKGTLFYSSKESKYQISLIYY
jgi:hypothetical protein